MSKTPQVKIPSFQVIGFCGLNRGGIDLGEMITLDPPSRAPFDKLFDPASLKVQFPAGYVPVEAKIGRDGKISSVRIRV